MSDEEKNTYRISDFEEDERPRERLQIHGANSLKNEELLAILLRVGVKGENVIQLSQRLLTRFGGWTGLHRAHFDDLCSQHGMGRAKAAQLKAALEIGDRLRKDTPNERPVIHSPEDAANLLLYDMSALEQEEMWVVLLDTRNKVISIDSLYRGSLNSSQIRLGELFKPAIRKNAAAFIVAHNHPSGDPSPSPDDIAVTRAIVQAGKLLDIDVLDHLVIGMNRWVSLKSRGLGFGS